MFYREEPLRRVLPGRRHGGGDAGLLATPAASALVLLAGMVGGAPQKIGAKTVKLWQARCVTPTSNPIERGARTAGEVITLLLKEAKYRERLLFLELDMGVPHLALVFGYLAAPPGPLTMLEWQQRIDDAVKAGELSRTFYAPYPAKTWQKRVDDAVKRGDMAHVCRLGPATLNKVAGLIAQDGEISKP